jgi:transcriptional regulator with XRE-family HTH domain
MISGMVDAWWRGARLQRARRRRKLTQAALATKVGAHVITVSRWERGDRQPSMRMLQKLAKALGVPVTRLLA